MNSVKHENPTRAETMARGAVANGESVKKTKKPSIFDPSETRPAMEGVRGGVPWEVIVDSPGGHAERLFLVVGIEDWSELEDEDGDDDDDDEDDDDDDDDGDELIEKEDIGKYEYEPRQAPPRIKLDGPQITSVVEDDTIVEEEEENHLQFHASASERASSRQSGSRQSGSRHGSRSGGSSRGGSRKSYQDDDEDEEEDEEESDYPEEPSRHVTSKHARESKQTSGVHANHHHHHNHHLHNHNQSFTSNPDLAPPSIQDARSKYRPGDYDTVRSQESTSFRINTAGGGGYSHQNPHLHQHKQGNAAPAPAAIAAGYNQPSLYIAEEGVDEEEEYEEEDDYDEEDEDGYDTKYDHQGRPILQPGFPLHQQQGGYPQQGYGHPQHEEGYDDEDYDEDEDYDGVDGHGNFNQNHHSGSRGHPAAPPGSRVGGDGGYYDDDEEDEEEDYEDDEDEEGEEEDRFGEEEYDPFQIAPNRISRPASVSQQSYDESKDGSGQRSQNSGHGSYDSRYGSGPETYSSGPHPASIQEEPEDYNEEDYGDEDDQHHALQSFPSKSSVLQTPNGEVRRPSLANSAQYYSQQRPQAGSLRRPSGVTSTESSFGDFKASSLRLPSGGNAAKEALRSKSTSQIGVAKDQSFMQNSFSSNGQTSFFQPTVSSRGNTISVDGSKATTDTVEPPELMEWKPASMGLHGNDDDIMDLSKRRKFKLGTKIRKVFGFGGGNKKTQHALIDDGDDSNESYG